MRDMILRLKIICVFLLFVSFVLYGCEKSSLDKELIKLAQNRTISNKEVLDRATKEIFSYYNNKYIYEIKKHDDGYRVFIEEQCVFGIKLLSGSVDEYRKKVLDRSAEIIRWYFAHFQYRGLSEIRYLRKQLISRGGKSKTIKLCQVRASKDMLSDSPSWKLGKLKKTSAYIKRNWSLEIDSFTEVDYFFN